MKIKIFLLVLAVSMLSLTVSAHADEVPAFIYDDKGSRDPFWPLINTEGVLQNYEKEYLLTELQLEGIIADASGLNVAIINGKIVKVNDAVGEYIVSDIQPNKVILLKGQETFEIILKKGE